MRIGIIGYGNMGSLIAQKLSRYYKILVYDKDAEKLKNCNKKNIASSNVDLVKNSDVIIIAVKPQDFDELLKEIYCFVGSKIVVSIAAAVKLTTLEKFLKDAHIIRAMPNLAIKINKGMICLSNAKNVSKKELNFVKKIFKKFGKVMCIKEELMDAATAISGSGPGFIFDFSEGKSLKEIKKYLQEIFIPQAKEAAVMFGFNKKEAEVLAKTTAEGSLKLLLRSKLPAVQLKNQVASKGGTTEAGLAVLHSGKSLKEAFIAARMRAKELSK